MAEVILVRDASTATSFATTTIVVTAGSESTTDSYLVDKGVYGPKYISAAISYPTPATTSVQADLQVSQGGVVWHTVHSSTAVNGERIEFFAPQGMFRFRCVAFVGGAPTISISVVARTIVDRLVVHSVGPTVGAVTEGAVALFGTAAAPIVQDTNATQFIAMNFDSGATGGWSTYGLRVNLACSGANTGNANAISTNIGLAARMQNFSSIACDVTFGAAGWVAGRGSGLSVYYSLPAAVMPNGGNYIGINIEFACPAGCDVGTPGVAAPVRTAMLGFSIGGDAAARLTFEEQGTAMSFVGFTAGSDQIINNDGLTIGAGDPANVIGLRVGIGTAGAGDAYYYIPLVPIAEWN